jgi:hypothetical protein
VLLRSKGLATSKPMMVFSSSLSISSSKPLQTSQSHFIATDGNGPLGRTQKTKILPRKNPPSLKSTTLAITKKLSSSSSTLPIEYYLSNATAPPLTAMETSDSQQTTIFTGGKRRMASGQVGLVPLVFQATQD